MVSCREEIKSPQGKIDIYTHIYFNASKSLDSVKSFHLAKLNYRNDTIIEIVPDIYFPEFLSEIYFVKDSSFYSLGDFSLAKYTNFSTLKKRKPAPLKNKIKGALYHSKYPDYWYITNKMSDTTLYGKKYKRVEVHTRVFYTRFYITPTDTIIPYSFYRKMDEDYGGRLERIDTYDKVKDMFISLQLFHKRKWDTEAEDIFRYNDFLKTKQQQNDKRRN